MFNHLKTNTLYNMKGRIDFIVFKQDFINIICICLLSISGGFHEPIYVLYQALMLCAKIFWGV